MKIILGIIIYFGVMISLTVAIALGVSVGLKTYFENKTSEGGN